MSDLTEKIIADDAKMTKIQRHQEEKAQPPEVAKMPLIVDGKGQVRRIRANLTRILTYYDDNLKNLFVYNEATHDIEIIEDRNLGALSLKKGVFDDTATTKIISYISNTYYLDYKDAEVNGEISALASTKSYNPIKDFLTNVLATKLERDPFEIVKEYLNIEDTTYNRIALDLFFRGAIARVLEPGIQFDFCLDLVGPQGGRKTTFLEQISMDWYTDQISTFELKDDKIEMVRSWFVNDDELEATKKMTFGGLKKAITVTRISFRPPYAKTPISLPVDFVFTRTTNEAEHLGDATGDRRFLGIQVGKTTPNHKKIITPEDLRDFWGNYYASYLKNSKLYFDEDEPEYHLIEKEREKFKKVDEVVEKLTWYSEQPIPDDFFSPDTHDWQRRSYYSQLQSTGRAYKSKYDEERGREWVGTEVRDRVSVSDIVSEIFHDVKYDKSLSRKIRLFFDNSLEWEKKRQIKFGKRVTTGYIRNLPKPP